MQCSVNCGRGLPAQAAGWPRRLSQLSRIQNIGRPVLFRSDGVSSRRAKPGRQQQSSSVCQASTVPQQGGGGGGAGSTGGHGHSGGGDDSESNNPSELQAILASAGKSLEDLPAEMAEALKGGRLSKTILQRFLSLQDSILAPLLGIGGMRERLLADPNFIVKVGIEVGIGLFTKSTAEYTKRQDKFMKEIDFVAANVIMALVADFCLVFLPAPTLSFAAKRGATSGGVQRWLASCPDNAFQKVPRGADPFSASQRLGAVLRNGAKLFGVGFGSSVIGVGATNLLGSLRQMLNPEASSPNPPQDVLTMSAAYASYMAVSSNLRYQVIAGVLEERGIEVIFAGNPRLQNVLSFVARTGNTFLGSLMWVDYVRLLGLQGGPKH